VAGSAFLLPRAQALGEFSSPLCKEEFFCNLIRNSYEILTYVGRAIALFLNASRSLNSAGSILEVV
jgi:hypothetical protein